MHFEGRWGWHVPPLGHSLIIVELEQSDLTSIRSESEPARCWLCGGITEPRLDARDWVTGSRFQILWCSSCEIGHTWPRPSDLAAFYPPTYYGGRHGSTERLALRRRCRFVQKLQPSSPSGLLVDIGCGEGTFLQRMRETGWSVAGTELDPPQGLNHGIQIESSLASLTDLGPIDVATMWHSLEHFPDPMPLLTALRQQMQPRGMLFVAVPNIQSPQARMTGSSWLHLDVPRHLSHFGPAGLKRTLDEGGFEIVQWWHQEFEYDLIGWSQSALSLMHPEEPPDFFNWLSHRAVDPSARRNVNIVAGVGLTALAAPLVAIMSGIRQGSTIIVAARVRT